MIASVILLKCHLSRADYVGHLKQKCMTVITVFSAKNVKKDIMMVG